MLNNEWLKIPLSFAEAPWYQETYGMSVITHLLLSTDENDQVTESAIALAEEININTVNLKSINSSRKSQVDFLTQIR